MAFMLTNSLSRTLMGSSEHLSSEVSSERRVAGRFPMPTLRLNRGLATLLLLLASMKTQVRLPMVYDVTEYLDEHPGGDDVLISVAGKDATYEFEDAGHSKSARELMKGYCVGEVDPSPVIEELEIFTKQQPSFTQKFMNKTQQLWAIPVAVVGISVVVSLLYLRKK